MNDSPPIKGIIFLGFIFASLVSGVTRIYTREALDKKELIAAAEWFIEEINRHEEETGIWIIKTNY